MKRTSNTLIEQYDQERLDFAEQRITLFQLVIGVWLLCIPQSLDSPGYALLSAPVPRLGWATILLVLGLARLLSIRWVPDLRFRTALTFLSAAVWGWFCYSISMITGPTMGVAIYGTLSVENVILYLMRVKRY